MASINKYTSQEGKITYGVTVRLKGYPIQTATFGRLTDAKKWVQQTEASIREGRHFETAESRKHSFNDLVARYCSEILPNYNEKEQKERKSKLEALRAHLAKGEQQSESGDFVDNFSMDTLINDLDNEA